MVSESDIPSKVSCFIVDMEVMKFILFLKITLEKITGQDCNCYVSLIVCGSEIMIIIQFNQVSLQNMQCFRIKHPKGDLKYLTLRKSINKNSIILRVVDGLTT